MSAVYETGHAKNLSNFEDLISFCQGYGASYNPTNERIKIPQLQAAYQTALADFTAFKPAKVAFDNATNARKLAFEPLQQLSTQVLNSFIVSGADELAVEDIKGINRKIQGKRASLVLTPQEGETTTSISASQRSYDRIIDHVTNLVEALQQHPEYAPNEEHLKISTLENKLTELKNANTALISSYTSYSNAKIQRDQSLYNSITGIIQLSKLVKIYVKSVFGANSPQYKQISGLEFTKPR